MQNKNTNFWTVLVVVIALWSIYVYFTMNAVSTTTTAEFAINPQILLWIRLTIVLPYLAIWSLGVFGWYGIYKYSKSVVGETGYSDLSNGVLLLLFGMIFTTIISSYRSFEPHDQSTLATLTILTNYLYAFLPLASFYLLFNGSKKLLSDSNQSPSKNNRGIIFLVVIALGYLVAVFTNPNRQIPYSFDVAASYYLPDLIIILTVLIPTILGWYLGIMSIEKLKKYAQTVKGVIFQTFFIKLARGIVWVILSYIVLHAILSLGTARLLEYGLFPVMVLIYIFLIALGIGFGKISKGSSQLAQIEEI